MKYKQNFFGIDLKRWSCSKVCTNLSIPWKILNKNSSKTRYTQHWKRKTTINILKKYTYTRSFWYNGGFLSSLGEDSRVHELLREHFSKRGDGYIPSVRSVKDGHWQSVDVHHWVHTLTSIHWDRQEFL